MDDYAGYKRLIVPDLADRGYFSGAKIAACDKAGITVVMPRPETSGNRSKGMYVKADFKYDAERDVYICPTENGLIYRYRRKEVGLGVGRYWTNEYQHCPVKSRCTRGTERRVTRWNMSILWMKCATAYAAPQHGRASFRDDQGLDGNHPFPDAPPEECQDRNGAERAGLQHQAHGRHDRNQATDGGYTRLKG